MRSIIKLTLLLTLATLPLSCLDGSQMQGQRHGYVVSSASIQPTEVRIEWQQTGTWQKDAIWQLPIPAIANELYNSVLNPEKLPTDKAKIALLATTLTLNKKHRKITLTAQLVMDNGQKILEIQWENKDIIVRSQFSGVPVDANLQDLLSYREFIDLTQKLPVIYTLANQDIHLRRLTKN